MWRKRKGRRGKKEGGDVRKKSVSVISGNDNVQGQDYTEGEERAEGRGEGGGERCRERSVSVIRGNCDV